MFEILIIAFNTLIIGDVWIDMAGQISNLNILLWNLLSDGLCLLLHFNWFNLSIVVLAPGNFKFIIKTLHHTVLTS